MNTLSTTQSAWRKRLSFACVAVLFYGILFAATGLIGYVSGYGFLHASTHYWYVSLAAITGILAAVMVGHLEAFVIQPFIQGYRNRSLKWFDALTDNWFALHRGLIVIGIAFGATFMYFMAGVGLINPPIYKVLGIVWVALFVAEFLMERIPRLFS